MVTTKIKIVMFVMILVGGGGLCGILDFGLFK